MLPQRNLPIIKGLDPFVEEEEFFDEDLLNRVEQADEESRPKTRYIDKKEEVKRGKASRQIPKPYLNDTLLQIMPSKPLKKSLNSKPMKAIKSTFKKPVAPK